MSAGGGGSSLGARPAASQDCAYPRHVVTYIFDCSCACMAATHSGAPTRQASDDSTALISTGWCSSDGANSRTLSDPNALFKISKFASGCGRIVTTTESACVSALPSVCSILTTGLVPRSCDSSNASTNSTTRRPAAASPSRWRTTSSCTAATGSVCTFSASSGLKPNISEPV